MLKIFVIREESLYTGFLASILWVQWQLTLRFLKTQSGKTSETKMFSRQRAVWAPESIPAKANRPDLATFVDVTCGHTLSQVILKLQCEGCMKLVIMLKKSGGLKMQPCQIAFEKAWRQHETSRMCTRHTLDKRYAHSRATHLKEVKRGMTDQLSCHSGFSLAYVRRTWRCDNGHEHAKYPPEHGENR